MDQTGNLKTGSEPWRRTFAILLVAVMVAMVAAPLVNAEQTDIPIENSPANEVTPMPANEGLTPNYQDEYDTPAPESPTADDITDEKMETESAMQGTEPQLDTDTAPDNNVDSQDTEPTPIDELVAPDEEVDDAPSHEIHQSISASVLEYSNSLMATPPIETVPNLWNAVTPYPPGIVRYAHAQVPGVTNSFYVIGGVTFGSTTDASYRYDAQTDTWNVLTPIPYIGEAATATCDGTSIFVLGGYNSASYNQIYDIGTDSWSTGAPLPWGCEGAAAGVWGGYIYLVGGDDDFNPGSGVSNQVFIYDIAGDSWVGTGSPMPEGVLCPGYFQIGSYLYVVGGWTIATPGDNSHTTQRYDMATDTWSTGPAFTPGKSDFAIAGAGQTLFAMGGDSPGGGYWDSTSDVWYLDLNAWPGGSWIDCADPLPSNRQANSAGYYTDTLTGSEVWSVGGLDGATFGWIGAGNAVYKSVAVPPILSPTFQSQYCTFVGDQAYYPLTLTNNQLTDGIFDLSTTGNAWPTDFLCPWPPRPQMQNPSFETGDFTAWDTTDLTIPFDPLTVRGAGYDPWGTFFDSAPTDGTYSLQTGFDGNGPGHILAGQDYTVPATGETYLLFDYRGAWDLIMVPAILDRTFSVNIEPAGGGVPIQTDVILTAYAGSMVSDTGISQGMVDLTPFAGTTIYIDFDWWVPEASSGPAFFELDNIRMLGNTPILTERFEGAFPPTGWAVTDNEGTGCVWMRNDAWGDGNYVTGGADFCADVNNDVAWVEFDTELRTPSIDLSTAIAPILSFDANYQNLGGRDFLDVDASTDSGATWTNLLTWNEDHGGAYALPSEHVSINLFDYAGLSDLMLRWHYYDPYLGDWDWYAQIDNVIVIDYVPTTSLGPVPAGGTVDFVARVTVPPGAFPGDFDTADIQARTHSDIAIYENFEGAFPPAGWTVMEYGDAGKAWMRGDAGYGRTNEASGDGLYAIADSDYWIPDTNTGLRTPSFSLVGYANAQLEFDQCYWDIGSNDYAEVLVSIDGGGTWNQIALYTTDQGPYAHTTISLNALIGEADVMVEFHYDDQTWDWYWMIDNVYIGDGVVVSSSNLAQVQTIWPYQVPWSDDVEGGADLWSASGLWHQVQDGVSPYPNSYSPVTSWYYGQDSTGDYDTGFQTFGRLETPPIDLTGVSNAVFSFAEWFDTEGAPWDQRWIQIDTGSGWSDIEQLPYEPMDVWTHRNIDLSPYSGQIIRLGFWFDTLDEDVNWFTGWYVDDLYIGPYGVDVQPEYQFNSCYWNQHVDYLMTVYNTGFVPDAYNLGVAWNTWPTSTWNSAGTIQISSTPVIPPGGSFDFIVRVTVPYGEATGNSDWADITATSMFNPGFTWDMASLETSAIDPYGVDLMPNAQTANAYVSSHYDYTMTVENTGVVNDRYDLSVGGNAWPVTFWSMTGNPITSTPVIAPGGTWNFRVRVTIPALAAPGSWDMADITVTSWGDPTYTWDTATLQTFSESPYDVTLLPNYQERTGTAGQSVDHIMTIYNSGVWPETYDLTATGNAWPVTFYELLGAKVLVSEQFEGPFPPAGWSVADYGGNNVWARNDAMGRANFLASGFCADADSDAPGPGTSMNTGLRTPSFSLVGFTTAQLEFDQAYNDIGGIDFAEVRVSTDGGTTWTQIALYNEDHSPNGPGEHVTLSLDGFVGRSNVMVEFHYVDDFWDWWWEVDNIHVIAYNNQTIIGPITSVGPIPPGGSVVILARVGIPAGLPPGSWDMATVTATCHHYFYVTDTAQIRTNGEPVFWYDVTPDVQTNFGWCPDWVEHRVQITNTGTETDWYLPMFVVGDDWWPTRFYTVDLRPFGIYNGIDTGDQTWIWGPVLPGETKEYAIKVFVPTQVPGAVNWETIEIRSVGDSSFLRTVQVCTRTSLPVPFYDDFERAGDTGVFGLYNDGGPLGDVSNAWTRTDADMVGVSDATFYSGWYSMFTRWGEATSTSCMIDMDMPSGIASCMIQRGGFFMGSEFPDEDKDLIVEYSDGQGAYMEWHELGFFPGGGTPGDVFNPTWVLPEDALNPRFQIRFRQTGGDGDDFDYWHIDDVYIGAPESTFGLYPGMTTDTQFAGPGTTAAFDLFVENYARHGDEYSISVTGNTWPTWAAPTTVPVGPDGSMNTGFFNVYVEVPLDTLPGDTDTATITATSVLDPTVSESIQITTVRATVYNIDQDTWHASIQDAVDLANPGEHIFAHSYVYQESVTVDKPLTITGEGADTTFIRDGPMGMCMLVASNNVEISGFNMQNDNIACALLYASGCNIHHNIISGGQYGVFTTYASNNDIHDNLITDSWINIWSQGTGAYETVFQDDFSTDTGQWTYSGSATRMADYMSLTQTVDGQVGRILYNTPITSNFVAEFDFLAGGGDGADGMTVFFYKEPFVPAAGGYLGCVDADETSLGYALEFDNYNNGMADETERHIAITEDYIWNHIDIVDDERVEDNAWHHVKVIVDGNNIIVFVDDMFETLLDLSYPTLRTFGGFGFSAGTGGLNNNHLVDNVEVQYGLPVGNHISKNVIRNGLIGVVADNSGGQEINNNRLQDNIAGVYLVDTTVNCRVYHNDFIDNGDPGMFPFQAGDMSGLNAWDDGYPSGGNYWNDNIAPDAFSGPLQNIPGGDGICDTQYPFPINTDNYPFRNSVAGPLAWPTATTGSNTHSLDDLPDSMLFIKKDMLAAAEAYDRAMETVDEPPAETPEDVLPETVLNSVPAEPVIETVPEPEQAIEDAPMEQDSAPATPYAIADTAEPVTTQDDIVVQETVTGAGYGLWLVMLAGCAIVAGFAVYLRRRK